MAQTPDCERVHDYGIAQPVNTLTSAAYGVAGLAVLCAARRSTGLLRIELHAYAGALLAVMAGSAVSCPRARAIPPLARWIAVCGSLAGIAPPAANCRNSGGYAGRASFPPGGRDGRRYLCLRTFEFSVLPTGQPVAISWPLACPQRGRCRFGRLRGDGRTP